MAALCAAAMALSNAADAPMTDCFLSSPEVAARERKAARVKEFAAMLVALATIYRQRPRRCSTVKPPAPGFRGLRRRARLASVSHSNVVDTASHRGAARAQVPSRVAALQGRRRSRLSILEPCYQAAAMQCSGKPVRQGAISSVVTPQAAAIVLARHACSCCWLR